MGLGQFSASGRCRFPLSAGHDHDLVRQGFSPQQILLSKTVGPTLPVNPAQGFGCRASCPAIFGNHFLLLLPAFLRAKLWHSRRITRLDGAIQSLSLQKLPRRMSPSVISSKQTVCFASTTKAAFGAAPWSMTVITRRRLGLCRVET